MLLRVIAAGVATPKGAVLVPGIALVALDGPAHGFGMRVSFAGGMPAPPYGTVEIGTANAPAQIAAFRLPSHADANQPLLVVREDGEHVPLHPSELDPDALTLAAGLDRPARQRLLDFVLTFCCPAFRLARVPAFAQLCTRLALDCGEPAGTARAIAQVLPDHVLVEGVRPPPSGALVVIGRTHVTQSRLPVQYSEPGLQVIPNAEPGDLVIATGAHPAVWTAAGAAPLPHVLALVDSTAAAARNACRRALAANRTGPARELLRDMDLLFPAQAARLADPAQPLAGEVELAVPDGAGGLFIAGWLRDPLGRVEDMALATATARVALPPGAMERVRRPDVDKRFAAAAHAGALAEGFLLHLPDMQGGQTLQPHLLLRLRSGAELRLTPPARSLQPAAARDAVLGCVPPGTLTPAIMRRCLGPAAARLHRAAMRDQGTPDILQTGTAPARPHVAIIVPLYRNLGFLRFQVAALAEDPAARGAEIIFVLDSPEQRGDAEHLLRGLHRLTGMPTTLVVMSRNLGYAAACNAGARAAHAPFLLLLNSDVVPDAPGWLDALLAPFSRASTGAAGPKLLFDDGSIQHAGLFFDRDEDGLWLNRHYHKGMPRHWAAAGLRRRVPGVTGAALMVRRHLFERVGGICEDYVIGDYEDSDFCLRLREAGATILYNPEAELFHFERRSIRLHQGYARTHAALYNRLLHHERWDAAMEMIMGAHAPGQAA